MSHSFRSTAESRKLYKSGRAIALSVILVAVLVSLAPVNAAEPPAPGDKRATSQSADIPSPGLAGLDAAIERVKASAEKRDVLPNKIWYEADQNAVIAVIPPSPDADLQGFEADIAAISAASEGFTVGIRKALRSLDEVKAIQRRVDADTTVLAKQGIVVSGSGITRNGDTVLVDVVGANDINAVKQALIDRYGLGIDAQIATGWAVH